MSAEALFRACGIAAMVTGVCIVVGSVLSNLLKSPVGTVFNFLALLIGLFAIAGSYLYQREEAGVLGVIAFVVVFVGLALMMCLDYLGAFIMPGLPDVDLADLQKGPAMIAAMVSGIIFLVGAILFGISVIRAGVLSKTAAVFFMIGFLPTPLKQAFPVPVVIGAALAGAGIFWWGLSLI